MTRQSLSWWETNRRQGLEMKAKVCMRDVKMQNRYFDYLINVIDVNINYLITKKNIIKFIFR